LRKRPQITETQFDKWVEEVSAWVRDSVSPFEDDTKEKQSRRVERSREDSLYFLQTYLPHYFYCEFADFHQEWAGLAELRNQFVLLAAPREHAKTTFFTLGLSIRDICLELRHFIKILSDSNKLAKRMTIPIRTELEYNRRLRHDFGDLVGDSVWQQDEFCTRNDIYILGQGRKDKHRSLKYKQWRPDRCWVDDFENDDNVRNPEIVKEGINIIRGAVLGSLGDDFSMMMLGNLFHAKSALSQLIDDRDEEDKPRYVSRVYDCWLDFGKEDQRPLWPQLWPSKRLKDKAYQMGIVTFNREMRNLCILEGSPIREEWFDHCMYTRDQVNLDECYLGTGVDPSAKNGENNDYKAAISVAFHPKKMEFYVLHAWIRHASPGEMFAACYLQHDAFIGPVYIEENMLHDFLHEAIENYARKVQRYISWRPVQNLQNKETRIISTLAYLIEHGKLKFIRGHSDQDLLIEQLIYILSKTVNDDGPDALEMVVRELQKLSVRPSSVPPQGARVFS